MGHANNSQTEATLVQSKSNRSVQLGQGSDESTTHPRKLTRERCQPSHFSNYICHTTRVTPLHSINPLKSAVYLIPLRILFHIMELLIITHHCWLQKIPMWSQELIDMLYKIHDGLQPWRKKFVL